MKENSPQFQSLVHHHLYRVLQGWNPPQNPLARQALLHTVKEAILESEMSETSSTVSQRAKAGEGQLLSLPTDNTAELGSFLSQHGMLTAAMETPSTTPTPSKKQLPKPSTQDEGQAPGPSAGIDNIFDQIAKDPDNNKGEK